MLILAPPGALIIADPIQSDPPLVICTLMVWAKKSCNRIQKPVCQNPIWTWNWRGENEENMLGEA